MEVLNRKSESIAAFFAALEELAGMIEKALKNRTPHLNGEKFLTNKDVCRMLQISARTLQDWRARGEFPCIRLKGKILYRESDIFAWLAKMAV